MTEQEQLAYIRAKLSDKWWRMNNLYMIENEQGELVQFKLRPAQELLFRTMWYLNIVLKARQLGFSTAIDIYLLDEALFNKNLKCGIIAHDLTAAGEIYRTKIEIPFDNLPKWLKDTSAQFGKAVARAIWETFALNPTPQIVKPVVEAVFNYDSFRGAPIDSPQDLAVKAESRYNEQTSLLMRELGELSGFSPKQLEHLLIGYTGTVGSYVMAVADGVIRASRPGESASWRADEVPLVKAVYRGTGPAKFTQHMEDFYRMLNEVNQLKRTVDQYRGEGEDDKADELLEEQGGILKARRNLSRTQQQIRVLRNRIELLHRDRTLSAEEKRQRIDKLLASRNELVYKAVSHNHIYWK
ncbi:large subunit terminase [Aeromonas hydrophila subsp. hydrophila ATCC 7966]|uniref:Large subunit terminase n=2 Tax=Aeromonas hydrophila TaxID=644 RepID=A0KJY4_AERHH|nr:large subunit terminase [Aeromonas hydrophila subsp. hydrophila ATCC 7966]